jgi:hypothetical protein
MENPPRWYNPNATCLYHSGETGHDIESCYPLRHKIQDLLDNGEIGTATVPAPPATPNVTENPLPDHGGVNTVEGELTAASLFIGPVGQKVPASPNYEHMDARVMYLDFSEEENEEESEGDHEPEHRQFR